jgi:hypothetical protein
MRKTAANWGVALVCAVVFLRGCFLAWALPYGDPLDELYHFGYAEFFAARGRPPRGSEPSMSRAVFQPCGNLPCRGWPAQSGLRWRDFLSLPSPEQARIRNEAFRNSGSRKPEFITPNYESQQPPLAYVPGALLLRWAAGYPVDRRLSLLRILSGGIAAASLPFVYLFFRRLLSRRAALAALVGFAAFPGLAPFVGRYSNDSQALFLFAVSLSILVDISRGRLNGARAVLLSGLLAAAFWTKIYALVLCVAPPMAALLAPRRKRKTMLRLSLEASFAALALFLPWMAHQHAATGDWLGITVTKLARQSGLSIASNIKFLPRFLKWSAVSSFVKSFSWPGTWSTMGAENPAAALAAAGLLLLIVAPNVSRRGSSFRRRRSWLAAGMTVPVFLLAQLLHDATFLANQERLGLVSSAVLPGWYLLVLLPVLLAAGVALGRSVAPLFFTGAFLLFAAAEWLQTMGVLPSVYGGTNEGIRNRYPFSSYAIWAGRPFQGLKTFSTVGLGAASRTDLFLLLVLAASCLVAAALLVVIRGVRGIRSPQDPHSGHEAHASSSGATG